MTSMAQRMGWGKEAYHKGLIHEVIKYFLKVGCLKLKRVFTKIAKKEF